MNNLTKWVVYTLVGIAHFVVVIFDGPIAFGFLGCGWILMGMVHYIEHKFKELSK